MLGDVRHQLGWRRFVGEHGVDFADMADLHHGAAAELARVGHQYPLAGIGHHGLGGTHFAVVEVEQGAVVVDAVGAHDDVVHLELVDHVEGGHAGNAAILGTDHAAGDDDLEIRPAGDDAGDVDVVGDHPQVLVGDDQFAGHGLDGGTDAHEQRTVIGQVLGQQFGDAGFFRLVFHLPGGVLLVLHRRTECSTAVETAQQVFFRQGVDVAANGLRGHVEQTSQLLDRHETIGPDEFQNLFMARQAIHGRRKCSWGVVNPNVFSMIGTVRANEAAMM